MLDCFTYRQMIMMTSKHAMSQYSMLAKVITSKEISVSQS